MDSRAGGRLTNPRLPDHAHNTSSRATQAKPDQCFASDAPTGSLVRGALERRAPSRRRELVRATSPRASRARVPRTRPCPGPHPPAGSKKPSRVASDRERSRELSGSVDELGAGGLRLHEILARWRPRGRRRDRARPCRYHAYRAPRSAVGGEARHLVDPTNVPRVGTQASRRDPSRRSTRAARRFSSVGPSVRNGDA